MTRKEFEVLVKDALESLPKEFKDKLQNVDIVIEEDCDPETLKSLGLYQGVPLQSRTHYYGIVMPDKITLYKQNIELECKRRGLDIDEEVKHVVQHEIAHHFGISDKHLKDLGIY